MDWEKRRGEKRREGRGEEPRIRIKRPPTGRWQLIATARIERAEEQGRYGVLVNMPERSASVKEGA